MVDAVHIDIAKLNLRLPDGFGTRANAIVRATAKQLQQFPAYAQADIATLNIPHVVINGSETNQTIARKIARAISTAANRQAVSNRWHSAAGGQHAAD